jgi:UDP-N-acetylmuramoyl-L-alanyl-D-glutamate--2,6-diaminopimelate ligase
MAPEPTAGGLSARPSEEPPAVTRTPSSRPRRDVPLSRLTAGVPDARWRGDPDIAVTDVTYRSGQVVSGGLFFCVPGDHVDGHDFAAAAEAAGASAVVAQRDVAVSCTVVTVPSVRWAMGPMSAAFFGLPSERFPVVGVTGTNGKTTTTYLLESIFRAAGLPPGVVGTTGVRIDGGPVPFDRTTPEAPDLQRLLARMADEGVGAAAIEVSSHGLDQRRVDGTRFACAVFTNLSQDHLDYHGTMEAYFEAKARLFTPHLTERAAVDVDTHEGRRLAARSSVPTITYGFRNADADVVATDVVIGADGVSFRLRDLSIRSPLRGPYNVSNCLAAAVAARQVGVADAAVVEGIACLAGVPGRLEPVEAGQPFTVLVDYAHTPDSLENVLRAARQLAGGARVILVFGCGGDRDRGKRPRMGEAATRLADSTVITSDNPRSEDPLAIISEIEPGAARGGGAYRIEPDRRAAIATALAEAGPGDVVVIAGKGHETGQQFAARSMPFDDRVVAREELEGLLGGGGERSSGLRR